MRCKLLVVALVVAALFVADQTFLTPKAKAAAINVSAAAEHRIRTAVNRYAEIQVAQREPYCYSGTGPDCFDCSGLVVASYRWAGINLPVRTSTQMRQWTTGTSLKYACCSTRATWRSSTAGTGPDRPWRYRPPTPAALR